MRPPWRAHFFSFKALIFLALALSGLHSAYAQDGDPDALYLPRPSYEAPGGGNALSPSQLAQKNQTADRFNRSQDTYVIAVAVSCACAGMVLLAVGGIAATIEMRKYELHAAAQAEQPAGQRPAMSGQTAEASEASRMEREPYFPVMVMQPDDTLTMACKIAVSPKQPEPQDVPTLAGAAEIV